MQLSQYHAFPEMGQNIEEEGDWREHVSGYFTTHLKTETSQNQAKTKVLEKNQLKHS